MREFVCIGVGAGGAEGAKAPPGLTKIVLLSIVLYFNLCTFDEIINLRPPRYYDLPTPMVCGSQSTERDIQAYRPVPKSKTMLHTNLFSRGGNSFCRIKCVHG